MAIVAFSNQVLNPNSVNPPYSVQTNYSLSAAGVDLQFVGSNVECVAFQNAPVSLTGQLATLSANRTTGTTTDSVQVRVDSAYQGVQFAVIYKNRTSSLFTANTAVVVPNGQTLTDNGTETSYPNLRRLVNLGYL